MTLCLLLNREKNIEECDPAKLSGQEATMIYKKYSGWDKK